MAFIILANNSVSKIGNHAKIGAGSVVLKKVKEGQTVFGVPAMPI